jgi:hypothetical protein
MDRILPSAIETTALGLTPPGQTMSPTICDSPLFRLDFCIAFTLLTLLYLVEHNVTAYRSGNIRRQSIM